MKKILLVNASRYFFDEGRNLLDRKDFQVFMAPTAMQALQIHRQEQIHLIVADLDMPEMGGDILCAKIREDTGARSVSFILVCHDKTADLERAANCGANICLQRPFTAGTLLGHVEKLLTISVRKGYRVLLRAKVKGAKDDAVFFCTSQNLSDSGMLIETDRALLPGDQLTCSFYLPGAAHITADGVVARVETAADGKHLCGIRFAGLSAVYKLEIEKFINQSVHS